jgi:hypothetical protein
MRRGSALTEVSYSRAAVVLDSGSARPRPAPADPSCSLVARNLHAHAGLVAAVRSRRVPVELLARGFRMENRAAAAVDFTYRGSRGWREWMSDLFEAFGDGARYDVRRLIAADDGYVMAAFEVAGASVWSHEQLRFSWIGVTWFRDGQATGVVGVTSRAQALTAIDRHRPEAGGAHASGPPWGAP